MIDPADLSAGVGTLYGAAACAVLVDGKEKLALGAGGAGPETPFDVASLTKAVATTPVALALAREGRLDLDAPVGRRLPGAAARAATARQLMGHTSGLPAWRPFFEESDAARLFAAGARSGLREEVAERFLRGRSAVVAAALGCPPDAAPGTRAVYSDVGFLVLGALCELCGEAPLDALFARAVATPLGLSARFLDWTRAPGESVPGAPETGRLRPRPGNPPGGMLEPADLGPDPLPDDDNAYAMGGVAPHAGLFASARDVARVGEALRRAAEGDASWIDPELARACFRPGLGGRALGLDTPSPEGSQAGTRLGRGPRGAAGHTGFTGCSLWIDLDRRAVVALCTNATQVARPNFRFRAWRPRWHDAVARLLG